MLPNPITGGAKRVAGRRAPSSPHATCVTTVWISAQTIRDMPRRACRRSSSRGTPRRAARAAAVPGRHEPTASRRPPPLERSPGEAGAEVVAAVKQTTAMHRSTARLPEQRTRRDHGRPRRGRLTRTQRPPPGGGGGERSGGRDCCGAVSHVGSFSLADSYRTDG